MSLAWAKTINLDNQNLKLHKDLNIINPTKTILSSAAMIRISQIGSTETDLTCKKNCFKAASVHK